MRFAPRTTSATRKQKLDLRDESGERVIAVEARDDAQPDLRVRLRKRGDRRSRSICSIRPISARP